MSDTQKHTKPNVPDLRFPGFEGEWARCTLGEIGEPYIGLTYSPADVVNEGGTIVFRSSNIQNGEIDYSDIVRVNKKIKDSIITRKDDLLICARNGSPRLIGKNALLKDADAGQTFGAFMLVFRSNDNHFVHQLLSTKGYYSQVSENLGARINQITTSNIKDFEFYFPKSLAERNKIADFLNLIDERISIQNKVIEKYESLIKALRRHIFSTIESEKEVTIADVLSYEQPTKYIVSDTEYSDNKDLTPVLTANKAFVLGYTEETKGIYDKGPCIILDDFTLDSKIVDFPFKVKSSAIKILSAKTSVHLRYIYEYLKFLDLNTEEHKRHYISEIEPMTIELPDEDAIQSIAYLFDRMDQRRQRLERDLQLLKYQKDYLLRALFI